MKIGIRKPSLKRSIKARTTGKIKRTAKKAISPGYGKKGMGWVKNPKKAAYNKIYSKTTKSIFDFSSGKKYTTKFKNKNSSNYTHESTRNRTSNNGVFLSENIGCLLLLSGFISIIYGFSKIEFLFIGAGLLGIYFYINKVRAKQALLQQQERLIEITPFLKVLFPNISEELYAHLSNDEIENEAFNYVDRKVKEIEFAARRIQLSSDPLEFFERRNTITEVTNELDFANSFMGIVNPADLEKEDSPGYLSPEAEIDFIKRNYKATLEGAEKLKTERGKNNRINRFIESLTSDDLPWSQEAIKYINGLTVEKQ